MGLAVCRTVLAGLLVFGPGWVLAQSPPAPPAAPASPAGLADAPIPTQHAVQAGIGRCAGAVDQLARATLRQPYNAQSSWSPVSPAEHVFQSVVGVRGQAGQPGGMAAIVTAPVPGETCDVVGIEVQPLPQRCAEVQERLQTPGKVVTVLEGMTVVSDPAGQRLMLLPGAFETCVAISVNSYYGAKPP